MMTSLDVRLERVVAAAPDGSSFATTVTVTFEPRDGKTLLIDAGFPNEQVRQAHEQGWPDFFDAFERCP